MPDTTIPGDQINILNEISNFAIGETIKASDLPQCQSESNSLDVLTLLYTFGLIELQDSDGDEHKFSIEDIRQLYFIRSLSKFAENDLRIFRSWEEGRKGNITSENIFYGTQFLHYLENERKGVEGAEPLRERTVVKAIIKASFSYRKKPSYLFEYHRKPEQLKLVGGLVEDSDINRRKALAREIDEETPNLDMELGEDYHLMHLTEIEQEVVSYTYGVYSKYNVHYYLVNFEEDEKLNISDQNRWLTLEEIKEGESNDGVEVFPLEPNITDLMESQSESIYVPARFDPVIFVKEYWQEIVAVISVISFILVVLRILFL